MALLTFEERNRGSYRKVSDVPQEITEKYRSVLPHELITVWETMGFGIFEDGFLQLVNPDEYEFVFDYVDKLLEPSIIWAMTALGDLMMWEGNIGWTVSPREGNRNVLVNVRKCNRHVYGASMKGVLNFFIAEKDCWADKDNFDAKPYLDIKDKLPPLQYGECYGYFPALVMGGSASAKNLKITGAKAYIDFIGQAAGKIIDLGDDAPPAEVQPVTAAQPETAAAPPPDERPDYTPFMLQLIMKQNEPELENIIRQEPNVNETNKHGQTPLTYTVMLNNSRLTQLLIAAGADVNAKDNNGNTALFYAEACNYEEITAILKKAEAE